MSSLPTTLQPTEVLDEVSNGHCDSVKCSVINLDESEQVTILLLNITGCIICGFISYLLRIFYLSSTDRMYQKSLKPRRPKQLIMSYLLVLLSLLIETISLIFLYWIPTEPARNTVEGQNKYTFSDGSPIYFNKAIDYFLHFLFWGLFLLFIHLKLYGLIVQIDECNSGYQSPRHSTNKLQSVCNRGGYGLIILWVIVLLLIMIFIRIPHENDKNASHYEHLLFWCIALILCLFLIWHFYVHFDEDQDTICLYQQWRQIRKLLIVGICGWLVFLVLYLTNVIEEYLMFKTCIILLYGTWITLFCYIETKWILNKLERYRKDSALSSKHGHAVSIETNTDYIDEHDRQIIHDMLVDSIDTAEFQDYHEQPPKIQQLSKVSHPPKIKKKIKVSLAIEQNKNIDPPPKRLKTPKTPKSMDSEDLYIVDNGSQIATQRTPNPPMRKDRMDKVSDESFEDMYRNNHHHRLSVETRTPATSSTSTLQRNGKLNENQKRIIRPNLKKPQKTTNITPVIMPTPHDMKKLKKGNMYRLPPVPVVKRKVTPKQREYSDYDEDGDEEEEDDEDDEFLFGSDYAQTSKGDIADHHKTPQVEGSEERKAEEGFISNDEGSGSDSGGYYHDHDNKHKNKKKKKKKRDFLFDSAFSGSGPIEEEPTVEGYDGY